MKSLSLATPIATIGCGLVLSAVSLPAVSAADPADGADVSTMGSRCITSNDHGEKGARACFLDHAGGNDDGLQVKDIDRGGSGVAYGVVYEKHWYGWTHEVGETDGPDRGGDRNMGFDIGDGNTVKLRVCVRNPDKDYGQGRGSGCSEATWVEPEGLS